jgi:hypothetical protein
MEGPESQNLLEEPAQNSTTIESLASVGLTRRRVAVLAAGLVALWLVGVFARQAGTAANAGMQAEALKTRNAAVERDVTALRVELELIQRPAYIATTARGYMIGSPGEIPLSIDRKNASLPANAPGSVGIKAESKSRTMSPLDSWLRVLFGP